MGSLISFEKNGDRIAVVSDNLDEFAPALNPKDVLGKNAEHVLGAEVLHAIRNAQILPNIQDTPEFLGAITIADDRLEVSMFETGDLIVLEMMAVHSHISALDLVRDISRLSDRMKGATNIEMYFSRILGLIRILSGYDRVQVLQHKTAETSTVIAESRRGPVPEILGADIARPIPLRPTGQPPYRIIHDTQEAAVVLRSVNEGQLELPLLSTPEPKPAKLAQLVDLKMQAELAVPLTLEDRLWGELQFQHRRPKSPSAHFRYVCRAIRPLLEAWIAQLSDVHSAH